MVQHDILYAPLIRILGAFLTSFLLFLVTGKRFILFLLSKKMGQPIRDDEGFLLAELHKSKKNTPTMGGLLISLITCLTAIIWTDIRSVFVLILLSATIVFSGVGAVDDWVKLTQKNYKGISGKSRMLMQTGFSLILIIFLHSSYFSSYYLDWNGVSIPWREWQQNIIIPFISEPIYIAASSGLFFSCAIQWFSIVGAANAVNLTDGLDGLATGVALFVTLFLVLYAFFSSSVDIASLHGLFYMPYTTEIAVYLAGMAGALLGFLWYNSYPAQVFMGDTGSLAIGGTLGTASVLMKSEWYLGLVGLIFVVETLSVIIQVISFKVRGKRVFRCSPLHHHFEYRGLHESKVVIRFWIVNCVMVVLGLIALKV